jgi:hypothetical protein
LKRKQPSAGRRRLCWALKRPPTERAKPNPLLQQNLLKNRKHQPAGAGCAPFDFQNYPFENH